MSEIQQAKIAMKSFLSELESAGLIKFPNLQFNDLFKRSEQNATIDVLAQSALLKIDQIYNKLDSEKQNRFIPKNEYKALQIVASVQQLQSHTEELKNYLKAILDPQKINFDERTMLGSLMSLIYDQLHYEPDKRQKMNELLFVELRNALSHIDYEITLDSFMYRKKNGDPIILSIEQLINVMLQYSAIIDVINDFITKIKSQKS